MPFLILELNLLFFTDFVKVKEGAQGELCAFSEVFKVN